MQIHVHNTPDLRIAEVLADNLIISSAQDGLDLLGNLYYEGFDGIILHERNITPAFFDLKNGMAGEMLQKFSNYRMRLAVVGSFTAYTGKSIRDFMHESNQGKHICFVNSAEVAFTRLCWK